MSKRNAIRIGETEAQRNAFAVERYGEILPETLKEITDWLKQHTDEYNFEFGTEIMEGFGSFPIIKTNRKGSAVYKIIDNEHDAQNCLANIRNPDFPKNKQGN